MADMALSQARSLRDIPVLRQLALLVGIAAAVAAGIWMFMWAQQPGMEPLYANMSAKDSADVADALRAANIEYKIDDATGAVNVPAAKLHEARLKLAGQGLPKGSSMGFEMIQQEQGFGTSQFIEGARYQHALEIELARTISSLQPVQNARVHLAVPKPSAFARSSESASASVFVELHSGRSLDDNQIASIIHLVASSVPDLAPAAVTLIDQYGRLLSRTDVNGEAAANNQRLEQSRRIEADYVRRIEELLTPITGPGRINAQVVADLDFTEQEEASETYKPNPVAIRSEQTSEDVNGAGATSQPQGVPGAVSNQPPNPNTQPQADSKGSQSRRMTRNYEMDKTLSHTRRPGGGIRRLSVAVLVDYLPKTDAKGVVTPTPLSQDELQKLQSLVREAVGFSQERGDSVSVQNVPFMAEAAIAPDDIPVWQRADIRDYARQGIGSLIVLILIFAVLRPVLRSLMQPLPRASLQQTVAVNEGVRGQALAPDRVSLGNAASSALPAPTLPYDEKLAQARGAVTQDPKRVAQVMKTWIGEGG